VGGLSGLALHVVVLSHVETAHNKVFSPADQWLSGGRINSAERVGKDKEPLRNSGLADAGLGVACSNEAEGRSVHISRVHAAGRLGS